MNRSLGIKLTVGLGAPLLVLLLPSAWIPLPGLSVVEHRTLAIFLFALFFWVLEPIPIYATSILVIFAELVLISDKAPFLLRPAEAAETFGRMIPYSSIIATLASPIIVLFLGGFFLAMAATKYRLDTNLARVLLRPFGTNPRTVLLGLMAITALFSMFMSNTATTAMMLAILAPILKEMDPADRGRKAFVLAIPFAANIGGIGTPIGTPPNAVAMKYLAGEFAITFGQWMLFAVPFVVVLIGATWLILLRLHPPAPGAMKLGIEGRFPRSPKAITVYITFALTILCWLFTDFTGSNSYIIAMIPVAVFTATGIINREDLKRINWDVLWLISGGIALGLAMEETGLSRRVIESIPFAAMPALSLAIAAGLASLALSTFMSHTAAANLLLPLVAALGASVDSLQPLGGARMLILVVTFACSLAMALPVSTPPNAMAYATGEIASREIMKAGLAVNLVGALAVAALMATLRAVGFF
jgi:sodium-dependent dicarboxylate transporter 2/3/5